MFVFLATSKTRSISASVIFSVMTVNRPVVTWGMSGCVGEPIGETELWQLRISLWRSRYSNLWFLGVSTTKFLFRYFFLNTNSFYSCLVLYSPSFIYVRNVSFRNPPPRSTSPVGVWIYGVASICFM